MSRCFVWPGRFAALALAVSIFVSCGDDSTGPVEIDIDPADAAAAMESVVAQFVDGNEAVRSIDVFTQRIFDALGVTAAVVTVDVISALGEGGISEIGHRLRASLARATDGADVMAALPEDVLGVWTFAPGDGYQLDPERQAPANTARFILYAVDPIDNSVILPIEEIGYLDLTDTGELPTIQMGMTAVVQDVTLLDVDIVGAFTADALDMDFSGFLSDGTEQLVIDLSLNGTQSAGTTVNFSLDLGALTAGFSLTERADNTGTFTVTFTDGTDRIEFRLNVRSELIGDEFIDTITSGSDIRYNGQTVAVITGTLDDLVLSNAAGDPLSQEELQALEALFDATQDMFEVFQTILTYAIVLLILELA